jgi:hypothetical protein
MGKPIADAAMPGHHQKREILIDLRVLKAVIHDDDAETGVRIFRICAFDGPHASGTVRSNESWRNLRQQQRFIANIMGIVHGAVDKHRTSICTAITPREKRRSLAFGDGGFRQRNRCRRLSRSTGHKIADA